MEKQLKKPEEGGPKQPEEGYITPYAISVLGYIPKELNLENEKPVEEEPWWMTEDFGNKTGQPPPASP
jgi:hypothetical protein